MELRNVFTFIRIVDLGSFTKAAQELGYSQSTVTFQIKQLESDIVLWENNIGFFAKSTNAETMIREVQNKIESAKKMIKTLEEKVRMIDQSGLDE